MRRQLSRGVRVRRLVLTALVLLLPAVSVHAAILDLTTEGSSGTINGSIFEQFMGTPAGTGVIDTFIRIQGFGVQQGYNSDGRPVQYNEDTSAQWNHSLLLNMDNVPIVTKGSVDYRAFLLDINQDGQPTLSLDKIEVYLEATGDLLGHPGNFSTPIYDLDAGEDSWIMLDSGYQIVYLPARTSLSICIQGSVIIPTPITDLRSGPPPTSLSRRL